MGKPMWADPDLAHLGPIYACLHGHSLYGSHMGTLWANPYTLMMFNVTYITRFCFPFINILCNGLLRAQFVVHAYGVVYMGPLWVLYGQAHVG